MPSEAEVRRRRQQQAQPPSGVAAPPAQPGVVPLEQPYGAAPARTIGAALAAGGKLPDPVRKPIKNIINKTLDFLNRLEGASAEFAALPSEGTSFKEGAEALKAGYKAGLAGVGTPEQPGYEKAFPGAVGKALNIVQPAGFLLPVGTAAKELRAVAGGAKEIAGLGVAAAAAKSPAIARNVEMATQAGQLVKGAVHQKSRMRNLGIEEALPLQREYFGNKAVIDHRKKLAVAKKIDELIPSVESNDKVRVALEQPKMKAGEAPEAFEARSTAHKQALEELNPNEREALDLARQWRGEIAGTRTREGVLEPETIAAFEEKHGVEYSPRVRATRDEMIAAVDAEIASQGPKPWLLKMRSEFETMPTNPLQKMIARARGGLREPGFLKERQLGPLSEIGALKNMFNRSVTETLGIADAATAYAVADKMYLQGAQDFLKAKGIAKTAAEKPDGYVKMRAHFPGLDDDLWIPKNVSDELFGISKGLRTADEEVSNIALQLIGHMNGMFRNMVLFMGSPEYFSRNMIQSPLNAYLDKRVKMGPSAIPTYKEAANISGRYMMGHEPSKTLKIRGTGMTEEKLIDTAIREGVFHAGMSQEAYVQMFGKPKAPSTLRTILTAPLPLDSSALVRGGKFANQLIENTNRLATFMHQIRKGVPVREAADDVLRVHFDYQHGLTSFQRNVIRPAFPLASWQMFNMPFQLEMLAQNPRAFLNQAKAIGSVQSAFGGPEPHRELITGFLENPAIRVDYDEKKKEWRYLMLGAWSTTADLDKASNIHKALDEMQNQFNFAPKLLYEWNSGWKIATSQQKAREIGKPGQYKQLFGRDIDKRTEYFLRIVRPLRVASETYDEFRDRGPRAAFERYFLGKTFPVNEAEQKDYFRKGYKLARADLLRQYRDPKTPPDKLPKLINAINQLDSTYVDVLGDRRASNASQER